MKKLTKKDWTEIETIIEIALKEDIGAGDITTEAVFNAPKMSKSIIIAKDNGILAGIDIAEYIFLKIDSEINFKKLTEDGKTIAFGTRIAEISGDVKAILKAERTALNFLGRMTGIATSTAKLVQKIKGTKAKILDTRKTIPGLRILDKYSVSAGGGYNHRKGLFDMYMIKDNHIKAAGGINRAVKRVNKHRKEMSEKYRMEVEAETIEQVKTALSAGVDRIMLDNMSIKTIKKAVEIAKGTVEIEVSGNVNSYNISEIAACGVDLISIGALTHSVQNIDFSLVIT